MKNACKKRGFPCTDVCGRISLTNVNRDPVCSSRSLIGLSVCIVCMFFVILQTIIVVCKNKQLAIEHRQRKKKRHQYSRNLYTMQRSLFSLYYGFITEQTASFMMTIALLTLSNSYSNNFWWGQFFKFLNHKMNHKC